MRLSYFAPKGMTTNHNAKLTEMTAEQLRLALVMSTHREIELGREVIELRKTVIDAMRKSVKSMKLAIAAVQSKKKDAPKTNVGNSKWLQSVTG
jgi:fatty acid/phospholipid biosynthesis enzyme